jgi:hypothetical protein
MMIKIRTISKKMVKDKHYAKVSKQNNTLLYYFEVEFVNGWKGVYSSVDPLGKWTPQQLVNVSTKDPEPKDNRSIYYQIKAVDETFGGPKEERTTVRNNEMIAATSVDLAINLIAGAKNTKIDFSNTARNFRFYDNAWYSNQRSRCLNLVLK